MKYTKQNIIIIVVLCVGLILSAVWYFNSSPDSNADKTSYVFTEYFDTIIKVDIYDKQDDSIDIRKLIDERLSEISMLSDNFKSYDGVENIYDLNNNYTINYNSDLALLLNSSIDFYNNYSNEFNIALGPIIDIWKSYLENCNLNDICEVPSNEQLVQLSLNINPNNIEINNNYITIESNMKIDLGGIAKGYAADEIGRILQEQGYQYYLIDAGGNIVASQKPANEQFIIGVIDPENLSENFIKLGIKNQAVVTSGDYIRYYEVDGVRYSHLINNETLFPSTEFRSVTVITNNSLNADAWTTMLFGMSFDDGLKLVENNPEVEAIWYVDSNTIYKSSGIVNYEIE